MRRLPAFPWRWAAALAVCVAHVPASDAAAPAGRYVISGGTVYDTKTRLTWQQTFPASTYTWVDARRYCASLSLAGSGWRVPSVKELVTLVDYGVTGAALIDATAFPNTPAGRFWSSTPWVDSPDGTAWQVSFGSGGNALTLQHLESNVRCVR